MHNLIALIFLAGFTPLRLHAAVIDWSQLNLQVQAIYFHKVAQAKTATDLARAEREKHALQFYLDLCRAEIRAQNPPSHCFWIAKSMHPRKTRALLSRVELRRHCHDWVRAVNEPELVRRLLEAKDDDGICQKALKDRLAVLIYKDM